MGGARVRTDCLVAAATPLPATTIRVARVGRG
jgi:hypothetical protein